MATAAEKKAELEQRLSRAKHEYEAAAATRHLMREQTAQLQAEHERQLAETKARLEEEARAVAAAEQQRMQKELGEAREYQRQAMKRDPQGFEETEREQLRREQRSFLDKKAAKVAEEETELINEEQRRLQRERQRELERQQRAAAARNRDDWIRDIHARKAELQSEVAAAAQDFSEDASSSGPATLLVMTVEMGNGKSDAITVREGDTPAALAAQFVQKHKLDNSVVGPLAEKVRENIALLKKQAPSGGAQSNRESVTPSPRAGAAAARPQSARIAPRSATSPRLSMLSPRTARSATSASRRSQAEVSERLSRGVAREYSAHLAFNRRSAEQDTATPTPKIDPLSEKLAGKRAKGAVFSRLHGHATQRLKQLEEHRAELLEEEAKKIDSSRVKSTTEKAEFAHLRSSVDPRTVGERLYNEGIEAKQKRATAAAHLKAQEEEDPELTFRPKISAAAQQLRRRGNEKPWQRMLALAEQHRQQQRQRAAEQKEQEVAECTFRPTISARTEHIARRKEAEGKKTFEKLFEDANKRQDRLREYQHWLPNELTFHPRVSSAAGGASDSSDRATSPREAPSEKFWERLMNSKKLSVRGIEAKRLELEKQGFDINGGEMLFHPKINRPPQNVSAERSQIGVFEYLYMSKSHAKDAQRSMQEQANENARSSSVSGSRMNERSARIAHETQVNRLRDLFSLWDTDKDGIINPSDVDPSILRAENGRDLVLTMKWEMGENVDFTTFCELAERVVARDYFGPSSVLFRLPEAGGGEEQPFRPSIDAHSKSLAARRHSSQHVFDALIAEGEAKKKRLEERAAAKQAAEAAECTFKPSISTAASSDSLPLASRRANSSSA